MTSPRTLPTRAVAAVVALLLAVPGVLLGPSVAADAATLPASVDLSAHAVPVGNQGSSSSCEAWAIGYALLGWYSKRTGYAGQPFAPMYAYSQTNGGRDAGSEPVDVLNLLKSQGIDTAAHYWQGSADWLTQPDATERANARRWRISGWSTVVDGKAGTAGVAAIKAALAAGRPVAISLLERPGFDTLQGTDVDHDVTGKANNEHEVVAMGYDSSGLLVQNSFGTAWGDGGFGRLGWDVISADVRSAYTISGFLGADRRDPTVSAPVAALDVGGRATTKGAAPYAVSFGASDGSGVTATRLYRQVDGGSWRAVALKTATTRTAVVGLAPGHRYRFAAAAQDRAGNWSARTYATSFRVGSRSEANAAIRYTKHWTRSYASSAVGDHLKASSSAHATASLTFTGRSVGWVATRSASRGSAKVYLDGHYRGTVNLYARTSRARVVVFRASSAKNGKHVLKLVQKTTHGRHSIDVDGFVVTS